MIGGKTEQMEIQVYYDCSESPCVVILGCRRRMVQLHNNFYLSTVNQGSHHILDWNVSRRSYCVSRSFLSPVSQSINTGKLFLQLRRL